MSVAVFDLVQLSPVDPVTGTSAPQTPARLATRGTTGSIVEFEPTGAATAAMGQPGVADRGSPPGRPGVDR